MSTDTQQRITEACGSVCMLLLEKNRKYGDSALNPVRIFSKSDTIEQIKVRIDDKLSRISTSGTSGVDEDTLQDLIGYLVLLKIATENHNTELNNVNQPTRPDGSGSQLSTGDGPACWDEGCTCPCHATGTDS